MNRFWIALLPFFVLTLSACSQGCGFSCPKEITGIIASANPTSVASGGQSTLKGDLKIEGSSGDVNLTINWSIVSGEGTLSAASSVSGSSITYTAPTVKSNGTAKIRATSAGNSSKTVDVNIDLVTGIVTNVAVSASSSTVFSSETTNLTATLTGIGVFNNDAVTWSITSGGGNLEKSRFCGRAVQSMKPLLEHHR